MNELKHYGTPGQKWGTRRWQYQDGRFNAEGKARYFGTGSDGDKEKDYGTIGTKIRSNKVNSSKNDSTRTRREASEYNRRLESRKKYAAEYDTLKKDPNATREQIKQAKTNKKNSEYNEKEAYRNYKHQKNKDKGSDLYKNGTRLGKDAKYIEYAGAAASVLYAYSQGVFDSYIPGGSSESSKQTAKYASYGAAAISAVLSGKYAYDSYYLNSYYKDSAYGNYKSTSEDNKAHSSKTNTRKSKRNDIDILEDEINAIKRVVK